MRRHLIGMRLLVGVAILFATACGADPRGSESGTATVLVGLGKAAQAPRAAVSGPADELAAVASVSLTVTAPDMAPITASLPLGGETAALTIPAGRDRLFSATAYDTAGVVTHTGSTTVAQLVAGARIRVTLVLNPEGPDTTPPTATNTVPTNGATDVGVNSVISATFSEAMNPSSLDTTSFRVTYLDPPGTGGSPIPVAGGVTYDGATRTATFTPSADLPFSTLLTATLSTAIQDSAGNSLAAYSWTFTTGTAPDTTAPTVISTSPADNATGVDPGSVITVTFSEAMDPTTINTSTVTVSGPSGTVAGTVGYSVTTATFTPSALAYDSTYAVTVTTGAEDAAGNPLAAVYAFTFTTQSPPGDLVAPTVTSTSPLDGATGVDPGTAILVTFSEAMDPTTMNSSTIIVNGPSGAVTGTVGYSGTTATFTPAASLAANMTYTATVTTGVRDLAGNSLAADYAWGFATRGTTGWGTEVRIDSGAGSVMDGALKVALNSSGVGMATWTEMVESGWAVYARRFSNGSWEASVSVLQPASIDVVEIVNPTVAVDDTGNAMAMWMLSYGDPATTELAYSYYDSDTAMWSNRRALAMGASAAQVAFDPNGNAIAVFAQYQSDPISPRFAIVSQRFVSGAWEDTTVGIDFPGTDAGDPQIAIDAGGNAMAVWVQSTGVSNVIVSNRYVAGMGWRGPIPVSEAGVDADSARLAVDSNGNALAVWIEYEPPDRSSLHASRYSSANERWTAPELIDNVDIGFSDSRAPRVVLDDSGNGIVSWTQLEGTRSNPYTRPYSAGTWGVIERLNAGSSQVYLAELAGNPNGNVMALWMEQEVDPLTVDVKSRYYRAGWGPVSSAETVGFEPLPIVISTAMDGSGNVVAAWYATINGTELGISSSTYQDLP